MSTLRLWSIKTAAVVLLVGGLFATAWVSPASAISAKVTVSPTSGPPGTVVTVSGSNFPSNQTVNIVFVASTGRVKFLGSVTTSSTGTFTTTVTVPPSAPTGASKIRAQVPGTTIRASGAFTVT